MMISRSNNIISALNICSRRLYQKPFRHVISRPYWSRSDLFSELSAAMGVVENRMRNMDREMTRIFDEIQRVTPFRFSRQLFPFDQSSSRSNNVFTSSEGDGKYHLEVDMQGFDPEDISIMLKDRLLTIQGKKTDKNEKVDFVRECCYKYHLPENVDPDVIQSFFNKGILKIEVALLVSEAKPKEIPIQKESSSSDKE